ncbi:helix-turn-helix domain-containing protein, partial [Pseudomonas aeruginosa]|uniref:helix-turn-helix domain-containing protein n=1 Tax=Pseudomonas aeruginosa TaxID=287 RepID=UPI00233FC729
YLALTHERWRYCMANREEALPRMVGFFRAAMVERMGDPLWERHCKRIFQLTPRQMIHKARLGAASQLLAGDAPITEIALRCGYTDHSAFSRQFKALTGLSPSQYRETHRQPRKA